MTGRYVVTELWQTYGAVFDFGEHRIVAAAPVESTQPLELEAVSEAIFAAWMAGGFIGMVDVVITGTWLNREYAEGRAAIIAAHFDVAV